MLSFHSLEGSFRHSRFVSLLSKALELVLFLSPKCLLRMLLVSSLGAWLALRTLYQAWFQVGSTQEGW